MERLNREQLHLNSSGAAYLVLVILHTHSHVFFFNKECFTCVDFQNRGNLYTFKAVLEGYEHAVKVLTALKLLSCHINMALNIRLSTNIHICWIR